MIYEGSKLLRFFFSLKPNTYCVEIDDGFSENIFFENIFKLLVTTILKVIVTYPFSINQF